MKKKKDLQDVWISFHSINSYDEEEPDSLEFFTDGQYLVRDNVGCLSYLESEVTGLEGTRTSVTILPDQVVVDRDGTVKSRMIFKEAARAPSSTPPPSARRLWAWTPAISARV